MNKHAAQTPAAPSLREILRLNGIQCSTTIDRRRRQCRLGQRERRAETNVHLEGVEVEYVDVTYIELG